MRVTLSDKFADYVETVRNRVDFFKNGVCDHGAVYSPRALHYLSRPTIPPRLLIAYTHASSFNSAIAFVQEMERCG